MARYRFLSEYIDPKTGRERLGTGGDGGAFHYYASVENVIKFGLKHDAFPPGQYNVYSWPEGSGPSGARFLRVAYKRADVAPCDCVDCTRTRLARARAGEN